MQKQHIMDAKFGLVVLVVALALMLLWPGLLQNLLVANGFMPHGHCYLWKPALVLLHLTCDTLIGLAYVAISATLTYLVYKSRKDIPFHWMFLAFGAFIVACAATHFMEVLTLWIPVYWLSGEIKLLTAVASVTTALLLPPLVPKALSLMETAQASEERKFQLEKANQELEGLYEKLKEIDFLKTQFFANVSHELRTPLALILGPTQKWLESAEVSPDVRHDLQLINRNASTLLKHVNDLLDVSKMEAGKMEVNYAEVDLAQVVRICASHFEVLANMSHISFSVETPGHCPAQVDPDKIQRICFNLLSNAFKFTPAQGNIRLILKTEEKVNSQKDESGKTNHPDSMATIIVEDNGPGVPPELGEKIFEPFRQGEGGDTRRFGGTGLGLAIVKELVALHGGTIDLGEAPSGGAIFTVKLPIVAGANIEVQATKILSELPAVVLDDRQEDSITFTLTHASSPLVLVVEDNPEMNRFISSTLAEQYAIATAFNGAEGLEKAVALGPDLILSDIMMPVMSGEALVQEVRKHPELDTTPIVLLSAKTDDNLRVKLLRSGAQDYLNKPISTEELRARVGNLIAMKGARDVLQQELNSKNQDLTALAKEVTERKHELQQLASQLEFRVKERTQELIAANELLQEEILDRQRIEEELQKEQEFLQAVLDNAEAGIVACDAEGVLTLFNRAAQEFHGLVEKPLKAENWAQSYDLYLPDGKTLMKKEQIPLWRTFQGEPVQNLEMMIIPKQRSARTLLASGQAIVNSQGKTLGAVVVMHDITERKRAEEERAQLIREQMARAEAEASKWRFAFLAEARMELSSCLDYETTLPRVAHLAVPILADYCIIDLIEKNGDIRRVEVAHLVAEKEAVMREIQRRYPPDMAAEGTAKVISTGESELTAVVTDWQLEAFARDSEHLELLRQLAPVSCMIVPLKTVGRIVGAIALVSADSGRQYDETDLALAEDFAHSIASAVENSRLYAEAQEANRMKDEFLAVLSHELRTPLNSMLGWVTLLRTRKFDEAKTAKALETIERNVRAQNQMIEELLDVSRIIRGKLQLKMRSVDMIRIIEAAIEALRPNAEAKGVEIESVLDSSVSCILGDADRLQQIVWNLVSNAIKFSASGKRVEVRLIRVDNSAQIQVKDRGEGISPEFLPFVFDRFRQGNSSTTRSHGGLGLGLAIVHHLVELHGGKVSAQSQGLGMGATFTVLLPLPEPNDKTA